MKPRTLVFSMTLLAVATGADSPSKTPTQETRAQAEARLESAAKSFGVSVADLKRLHEFGYSDVEVQAQIKENGRTARQLIVEREVVDDLARVLADVNQRVYKMPAEQQASEREKALKDAVAKIRRQRKASRDELRLILSKTSFLRDDELKRVVR